MPPRVWQLQEAKARFSEVVNLALEDGPQTVTRRGREVVAIVALDELRNPRNATRPGDFFRSEPYLDGVLVERDHSPEREVDLCDS